MKILYAQEDLDFNTKSVFLAGPTPRKKNVKSWRPEALKYFEKYNFKGAVLLPEFENRKSWTENFAYDKQIIWEHSAMEKADIILFWIPRSLPDMPAFTTNIEYGYWLAKDNQKIRLGIPSNAEKMDYIYFTAEKNNIFVYNDLEMLIKNTLYELRYS